MRKILLLLSFILFPAPANAIVTYHWYPDSPSVEDYHYTGEIVVTDEAFARGSTGGNLMGCYIWYCYGDNDGLISFSFSYLGAPTGLWGRELMDVFPKPLVNNIPVNTVLVNVNWGFDLGSELTGSLYSLGVFDEFAITPDGEFYLAGSDAPGCGYFEETRYLCRGSFGTWRRVPEPPAVALIFFAVTGLIFAHQNRRNRRTSTTC